MIAARVLYTEMQSGKLAAGRNGVVRTAVDQMGFCGD